MAARLLLIEDHPDIRTDLTALLELRGYLVSVASNGLEALDLARDQRPDLILMDLRLPVMDGWRFREEMLKDPELASAPTILVSAAHDLPTQARELGAVGYVSKPIDLELLFELIARHCC